MNKLSKLVMLSAGLVVVLLVASAQNNQPPQNQPLNLTGEWEIMSSPDRGLRLLFIQNGNSVKATFIRRDEPGNYSPKCDTGGQRDYLFEGQLQGTSLSGKIMWCTQSKPLVEDCKLDAVYETTFKTTSLTNEILDATRFAEGWGFDKKDGHLVNCHRDDSFNRNPEFKLYRKCAFSGLDWVKRYQMSTSTDDLAETFRPKVNKFIAALQAAGAIVSISSTYRPVERSYLMHYAWQIDKNNLDPRKVPGYPGVDICWVHRKADGDFDLNASRAAAQEMTGHSGYNLAHDAAWDDKWSNPAHDMQYSTHNLDTGIDMTITWTGDLTITDGNGTQITINSTPRNGNDNADLHSVGATYGVLKLATDPPHWSNTGH
jgi:hypothetical protein